MERLTSERCSGIKTGYWSPARKEELVQRLAEYENTGLTPEEIKGLRYRGKWIRSTEDYYENLENEVVTCVATCPNCGYRKIMFTRTGFTEEEMDEIWQVFAKYNPFCPQCGARLGA